MQGPGVDREVLVGDHHHELQPASLEDRLLLSGVISEMIAEIILSSNTNVLLTGLEGGQSKCRVQLFTLQISASGLNICVPILQLVLQPQQLPYVPGQVQDQSGILSRLNPALHVSCNL